jgi:hypothetical protein
MEAHQLTDGNVLRRQDEDGRPRTCSPDEARVSSKTEAWRGHVQADEIALLPYGARLRKMEVPR